MKYKICLFFFFIFSVLFVSCGGSGPPKQVTVTWDANVETAVNTTGGGYKLYYSQTSGFDAGNAVSVDIPYVSGTTTPTTTRLSLASGTVWYFKVQAYGLVDSALKESPLSPQFALDVR